MFALQNQADTQCIRKLGPHCGNSDPLIEEMAALPEFRDLHLNVFKSDFGGCPAEVCIGSVSFPAGYHGPVAFKDRSEVDGPEGHHCWWMAPARALLQASTTAQSPAHGPCACGQKLHLPGARFCSACASELPDAGDAAAVRAVCERVGGDLLAMSVAIVSMKFKHNSPHKDHGLAQGRIFNVAVDRVLAALLTATSSSSTGLLEAVRSLRTAHDAWHGDLSSNRFGTDYDGTDSLCYEFDDFALAEEDRPFPTRLCKYFTRGQHCPFGTRCKFLHSHMRCGPDCIDCVMVESHACRLAGVRLWEIESTLLLRQDLCSSKFESDAEMLRVSASRAHQNTIMGILATAATKGHYLIINHDNDLF